MDYYGDLRIAFCINFCKRWYFIFDGVECNGPLAIDGLVHIALVQTRKEKTATYTELNTSEVIAKAFPQELSEWRSMCSHAAKISRSDADHV